MKWHRSIIAVALLALSHQPTAFAAETADSKPPDGTIPDTWVKAFQWRSIGPANMGGRITALAVYEADPCCYWVATASGGLLKTTNNGVTFEHQFDKEATVSIGDVCVAPSNKDIVWVGTGENNPRNSVSFGDGVYKSTDGGKSWKNMGLKQSFQIGKILIHPKNPDIVYVGALGRLYGPNPERGLFKTTDGGKTWAKIHFIDDKTGVIDMRTHPADPETLIVATWERQRDGYDSYPGGNLPDGTDGYDPVKKWGPGAGLFKTTDGGKSFKKLTKGLPTCNLGRVGLDWYVKDPNVVFAIVDCEKIGMGKAPAGSLIAFAGWIGEDGDKAGVKMTRVLPESPAETAGIKPDDVIQKVGDKAVKTNEELQAAISSQKPDTKVKVKFLRGKDEKEVEVTLAGRPPTPGYSGFQSEDAGDDIGAKLTGVTEGSPAERAGLKVGDVIQKIGDKSVKTGQDLQDLARTFRVGDKVKLEVVREAAKSTIELTMGQRAGFGGGGGATAFGPGGPTRTRPYHANYGGQRENVADQGPDSFQYGGVYKSTDAGESWTRINSVNPRPMYFSQVRVDPSDDKYLYVLGISLYRSTDGGKTFRADGGRGVHADQHCLWINPRDGRHALVGCDGGYYVTYDRMQNWDHLNHMAIGQFYHVAVCSKKPYYVYGGLQDNGSWGGPSVGLKGGSGPINEDWISVGSGDGYVCRVDPNDPDLIYFESQDGRMGRRNLRTGERATIQPARVQGGPQYRFNWNTPFILSNHNSKIFYCAGNYVFRSVKQGDDLRAISPEITRTKQGSGTAVAESPRNQDVLWAGTDDGNVWVTRNGGKDWANVTAKVGLPGPRWVATIEASRFVEGRAYVAFDGHRSDDDAPCLYVTEDFGMTWKAITTNLPTGSTRCLREDLVNQNLLYCGTEFGIFTSVNRGASWTKLNNNLPTVAVHEIAVHPTAGEIVAATHGRSLWILDITALRQITATTIKDKPVLYKPNTVVRYNQEPAHGRTNRRFMGQNPPTGAQIYFSLPKKAEKVTLNVLDIDGNVLRQMNGPSDAGLHHLSWDLARAGGGGDRTGGRAGGGRAGAGGGQRPGGAAGGQRPGGAAGPGPGGPGGFQFGRQVPAGAYRVVLTVDGVEFAQSFRVEGEATAGGPVRAGEDDDD